VPEEPEPDSPSTARTRRALLTIATAAAVLFVIAYVLAVRTHWGQRLDAAALNGRGIVSTRGEHVATRLHASIDIASLTLLGGAIVLVALVRRHLRLAIGAAVVIVGSIATSELLKHTLPRPYLGIDDALRFHNTFPSGHTTVAMALSISAVFVAPRNRRAPVAALGVLFAAAMGCSLVATASHRPSDTIGAALVVTAWSAAVAAVLLRSDPADTPRKPTLSSLNPWMALGGIALLVGSFAVAAITILAAHYGRLETIHFGRAYVAAAGAITGSVLICTAALLIALQSSDLDRSDRRVATTLEQL
jgi:membrane-associated phospholipid phosphatase